MKFQTYADAGEYLKLALPFLEERETANNLILGVTIRLRDMPGWTDLPPYLALALDTEERPVMAAAITPPQNLLLTIRPEANPNILDQALAALVENLLAGGWTIPGVNAEYHLARRFANRWAQAAGQSQYIDFEERLYELSAVIPPSRPVEGMLRLATAADFDTLVVWYLAFYKEALGIVETESIIKSISRRLENKDTYLWDIGKPVSMAGKSRPTAHGASVGPVYTPPELRGRGYASACVAALSQLILDSGKKFCTLFTDLSNPTSNAIYQNIGYRPVCDYSIIRFAAA
jgi:uncharacterized protein